MSRESEVRIIVGGKQVHVIRNPVHPPVPQTHLDIPDKEHIGKVIEVFITKVKNSYPRTGDTESPQIIECEAIVVD